MYQSQFAVEIKAEENDSLAMDPLEKVKLDRLEKFTYISYLLFNEEKEQLRLLLLNNINIFTWNHSYMVGINPTMASHKLNIILVVRPVRQKVRRHQIIKTKLDNLLRVGFIR